MLHCRPIPKTRTGYRDLRSTRILDFRPNRDTHEAVVLTAHAVADRYQLSREWLRDQTPDRVRHLSRVATKRVMAWYALRYARSAWPDEFVARVGPTEKALVAALDPLSEDIAEVRVSIAEADQELTRANAYNIAVYFVVDESVWEQNIQDREAIHAAYAAFVAALNGCSGVQVDEEVSGVFSGGDFSWQATRSTDEWNFAVLTHRE